ncbi:MAG TPA: long-chain fatty acid--CoA ligase [Thermoanaerobaculia bacterium]|jgi:long-chain acyl-CoA synthetase|nr:long-chain fatty acid--CoA ligase [Thermoanaerobaculia bacterium]
MTDDVRTLCDIFLKASASGKADLLVSKVGGEWKGISAADFSYTVRALSMGLNALGIQPGDRAAILSENRPEWAMSDYAILCAGAWTVPIYPTLPAHQIAPLLRDSGARAIFVSSLEQLGKILTIRAQCPQLEYVVCFDANPPNEPGFLSFSQAVDRGRPLLDMNPGAFEQRARRVRPEDVATIIYTSGTTGEPKGAMLTHRNFVSNVLGAIQVVPITSDGVAMCFLPLSHVFERMLDYAYAYRGGTIAYAESVEKLRDNFVEVNPSCFGAVPRVYEKILARIRDRVEAEGGLKKKIFDWAVGVGKQRLEYDQRGESVPAVVALKAKAADALVFKKIRHALGTRFRFAVSGGAPLARDLAEFFWGAGVTIYEGYGLTETSPVICVNGPHAWRLGTVGKPIPGVEVKIASDGEILTRGPHVMKGYFNKPDATAEAIDPEGWFHTGDIGQFDADGFLAITDRKKDLIVLAGGKKAAPQPIEQELKKSVYIALPIVLGDRHKFLAALIVPNFDRLKEVAAERKIHYEPEFLDASPEIRSLFQKEIDDYNTDKPHHEQIRAFALLPSDLTVEDGSITPTLKVKRRILESRYQSLIQKMYQAAERPHVA